MDKKIKNKKELEKKKLSVFQILILVIGFMAFVWIIGNSLEVVSAEGDFCDAADPTCPEGEHCSGDINAGQSGACIKDEESGEIDTGTVISGASTIIGLADKVGLFGTTAVEAGTGSTAYSGTLGSVIPTAETAVTLSGVTGPTSTSIGLASVPEIISAAAGAFAGAFIAAYGFAYIVKWLGGSDRNVNALMDTALYVALAVAVVATVLSSVTIGGTSVIATLLPVLLTSVGTLSSTGVGIVAAVVVIVAMSIYLLASYQDYSQEIFTYTVQQWQPPTGGKKCLDCNKLRYGCGEYQCHSFGQGCNIINKGTSEEACVWMNPNDILPPELSPISEILKPGYKYIPSQAVLPNERGVKIIYNEGCIPPFTDVLLAVRTNEPANCKIDTQRKANFTDMIGYMMEGTANTYNHTLLIPSSSMPSNSSLEDLGFSTDNNKDYQFFIRCIDTNGNPTTSNFLMEFCIDSGPDLAAPIIQATSYAQNAYVSFNTTSVPLEVYTNEPADCRWDFQDLNYPQMKNNMTDCSQKIGDYLKQYYYGCKTELTGVKNGQKNNYYIRCKDQPWFETNPEKKHLRNENKQSYVQSLTGTNPLIIDSVLINDRENNVTIKDATDIIKVTLKVRTSKGAEEGKAKCSYLLDQDYIYFYNLGVPEYLKENTQDLWLQEGNYNFSIRCSDFAGNLDYANAIFKVEKDIYPPEITRVYHEQGKLKLITDEAAQCVFSNLNCNYLFEDGAEISNLESLTHYVDWNTEINYYIKCKDKYGNYPLLQNQCSIIVRGSEYTSG